MPVRDSGSVRSELADVRAQPLQRLLPALDGAVVTIAASTTRHLLERGSRRVYRPSISIAGAPAVGAGLQQRCVRSR